MRLHGLEVALDAWMNRRSQSRNQGVKLSHRFASVLPLNVVCFRFGAEHLCDLQLNKLNEEILFRLHESGIAIPSYTTLQGKYALRVAITNHRSRRDDFALMLREVIKLGVAIAGKGDPGN